MTGNNPLVNSEATKEDLVAINEHMDWALNEKERQIRALRGILKDKGEEIERLREEKEKAERERERMRADVLRIRVEKARDEALARAEEEERRANEAEEERDALEDGAHNLQIILEREKRRSKEQRVALRIAARILLQSGLIRIADRKTGGPVIKTEKEYVACIEKSLLAKARKTICGKEKGK